MKNLKFTIITFYQFKKNRDVKKLINLLKHFCSFHKIKGTILLAEEGINGTVAGLMEPIRLLEFEFSKLGFTRLELKRSMHEFMPFNRLKVKIKNEIVTFIGSQLDVENIKGKYVVSSEWNSLINEEETLLIDVRNNFEVKVGSFKGSINPKTKNFSEFKKYVDKKLSINKNRKVALFCTGGIRCEKASSYMLQQGFNNIFQLKGGILQYLEDIPAKESKWHGECFVFDNRVSVQNEMKPGTYELCHACRNPLSLQDRSSKEYVRGISCPKCINKISKEKKLKLKERNKQIEIAKKKGFYNPYIKYTPSDFS
jgi:UPF0176 protein